MQNKEALTDLIRQNLNEGEEVLWASKPTGMKMLDLPYATAVIIRWIICLAIAILALLYRFVYIPSADYQPGSANIIVIVAIVALAAISAWPLLDILKLKNKCYYYITNQRALALVRGSSYIYKEKLYADITEVSFDFFAEKRGNIYIGQKQSNSMRKARSSVLSPPIAEDEGSRPLIFHSVLDPDEIISIIPPLE